MKSSLSREASKQLARTPSKLPGLTFEVNSKGLTQYFFLCYKTLCSGKLQGHKSGSRRDKNTI